MYNIYIYSVFGYAVRVAVHFEERVTLQCNFYIAVIDFYLVTVLYALFILCLQNDIILYTNFVNNVKHSKRFCSGEEFTFKLNTDTGVFDRILRTLLNFLRLYVCQNLLGVDFYVSTV